MPFHLKGRESLQDSVIAVMRAAGDKVLTPPDITDLVRRRRHLEHSSSIGSTLASLRKKGLVERVEKGKWRWIGGSE